MTGQASRFGSDGGNASSDDIEAYMAGRGLKPDEAARYLGLSTSTLAKMRVGTGSPKYVQTVAGGAVRYRIKDLDEWMKSRTVENTSER